MRVKILRLFLSLAIVVLIAGTALAAREKVILDSDMVELFDDGVAMIMLANHPKVDLLGVTVVAGNGWLQPGIARGIRQLELLGRNDIPVVAGARWPMRTGRFEAVHSNPDTPGFQSWWGYERKMFGIGTSSYVGAFGSPEPVGTSNNPFTGPIEGWRTWYQNRYGTPPTLDILTYPNTDPRYNSFKYVPADEFIVEQVNANPGEVTIIAIGPCTNLMMAAMKDPTIVPKVKRVLYMGGAVNVAGNTSPAAEFNWWFDPEAARFSVRQPWGKPAEDPLNNEYNDDITQYVVPLDVCEKLFFTHEQYDKIVNLEGLNPGIKAMFENNYGPRYASPSSTASSYVWDAITVAILLGELDDNDIVLPPNISPTTGLFSEVGDAGYMDWWIDVDVEYNLDYGRSPGFSRQGPIGTQKVRIINTVDEEKFWDVLYAGLDPTYATEPIIPLPTPPVAEPTPAPAEPTPTPAEPIPTVPPEEPIRKNHGGCTASPLAMMGLLALTIVPVLFKKR